MNRITANVIKGKYKDKTIEIDIGETPSTTVVKVDGKKAKDLIQAIYLKIKLGEPNRITIEYLPRIGNK